jgi:hypothetical protein
MPENPDMGTGHLSHIGHPLTSELAVIRNFWNLGQLLAAIQVGFLRPSTGLL